MREYKTVTKKDIFDVDKILEMNKFDILDTEFEKLQEEVFKELEEQFLKAALGSYILSTASVAIGNLMMIANEKYGVAGVRRLATDYAILFNDTLMIENDSLRNELIRLRNELKRKNNKGDEEQCGNVKNAEQR